LGRIVNHPSDLRLAEPFSLLDIRTPVLPGKIGGKLRAGAKALGVAVIN
jgi:hypothetical protein